MDTGEFLYLLGGMLDVTAPDLTEPRAEKVARKMREAHEKAVRESIQRRSRGGEW